MASRQKEGGNLHNDATNDKISFQQRQTADRRKTWWSAENADARRGDKDGGAIPHSDRAIVRGMEVLSAGHLMAQAAGGNNEGFATTYQAVL